MSERLQIASKILAHMLGNDRFAHGLAEGGPTIHQICEGCLDAADALIKTEGSTRGVPGEERKILEELVHAEIEIGTLIHLKQRARRIFGYGL